MKFMTCENFHKLNKFREADRVLYRLMFYGVRLFEWQNVQLAIRNVTVNWKILIDFERYISQTQINLSNQPAHRDKESILVLSFVSEIYQTD